LGKILRGKSVILQNPRSQILEGAGWRRGLPCGPRRCGLRAGVGKQGAGLTARASCAPPPAWEAHAAAAAALTGQSAAQGATSDPGRKRLLELNAQAVDPALGFGTLAPGARLQHGLTAGIERAKHKALWARARAVRPPGSDAATWHAAENAEHLKAYAAKAAFECACGISRTALTAWPGTDTALDNDQLQTFAAAHLGIGDPELSIHVGCWA
jgi:hypothetical protein